VPNNTREAREARKAREYENTVRSKWLLARAIALADEAWKRLAPKTEGRAAPEGPPSEQCTTRAFVRGGRSARSAATGGADGVGNWTCIRVDGEHSFAPRVLAPPEPEEEVKTDKTAAICLVGQARERTTPARRAFRSSISRADCRERSSSLRVEGFGCGPRVVGDVRRSPPPSSDPFAREGRAARTRAHLEGLSARRDLLIRAPDIDASRRPGARRRRAAAATLASRSDPPPRTSLSRPRLRRRVQ
jgi:hypothetical protein